MMQTNQLNEQSTILPPAVRSTDMDGLGQVVRAVERKLGLALALLVVGIAGILLLGAGQPAFQYLAGAERNFSAIAEGAGCGSHLTWVSESEEIPRGSTVRFTNDAGYWLIPVLIERRSEDGSYETIAESPKLRDGESWTYTFWHEGEYRITSSEDVLRYAGLETTVTVG